MRNIGFIFMIFMLFACNPDKHRKSDPDRVKFSTSDASELFFRNMRQPYYDKTVMEEAKLEVYRTKARNETADHPVLNLAIVVNWRYDEAYVLVEPNAFLQKMDTLKVMWQDTTRQDNGYYYFTEGNKAAHFTFASHIYNSLLDQQKLCVMTDSKQFPLLHDYDEREAFRKTMVDYYRLVDLF